MVFSVPPARETCPMQRVWTRFNVEQQLLERAEAGTGTPRAWPIPLNDPGLCSGMLFMKLYYHVLGKIHVYVQQDLEDIRLLPPLLSRSLPLHSLNNYTLPCGRSMDPVLQLGPLRLLINPVPLHGRSHSSSLL